MSTTMHSEVYKTDYSTEATSNVINFRFTLEYSSACAQADLIMFAYVVASVQK